MKKLRSISLGLLLVSIIACSKKDTDEIVLEPQKSTLIYPSNNENCEGGTAVSDEQASLNFWWNKAEHADSYVLKLDLR